MKPSTKCIIFLAIGIVIGLALGWGIGFKTAQSSFSIASEIVAMNFAAWETEAAYRSYKSSKPEIAEYALTHAADILVGLDELNDRKQADIVPADADLGFTYIRLGKLAEANGRVDAANDFYEKGLAKYQKYANRKLNGKKYTVASLKDLVSKIDEKSTIDNPRPFSSVIFVQ